MLVAGSLGVCFWYGKERRIVGAYCSYQVFLPTQSGGNQLGERERGREGGRRVENEDEEVV